MSRIFILTFALLFLLSGCAVCDCIGLELVVEFQQNSSHCTTNDLAVEAYSPEDNLLNSELLSRCTYALEDPAIGRYYVFSSVSQNFRDTLAIVDASIKEKPWSPFRSCNCGPYYEALEMKWRDSTIYNDQYIFLNP